MSNRWVVPFFALAFSMVAVVVATLWVGGRPDPIGQAVTLDGAWRFHPGDDLRWADPQLDERSWERINLVSRPENHDNDVGLPGWLPGWGTYGYANLEGFAWYRRHVALPAEGEVSVLGPTMVDDGYQMFWNGTLLGGIGRLNGIPKVNGARPFLVSIPRTPGERSGVLAIRAFMQPHMGRDSLSGGLRSVPTLVARAFGERLHRAQWLRTIAGYVVEVAVPIMMVLLAFIALRTAPSIARGSFARWLAVALIATAGLRLGNALSAWTNVLSIVVQDRLNTILLSPLAMFAWCAAWNDWTEGRERGTVLLLAVAAWTLRVVGAIAHADTVVSVARSIFIALFVVIAVRITRRGARRPLALAIMMVIAAALFVTELKQLGVPDIWFPFAIGVTLTQYAYALALLLLPLLLLKDLDNPLSVVHPVRMQ